MVAAREVFRAFSETYNQFNVGLLDPYNPDLDYGDADFDIRHRLALSAIWELPYAKNLHGIAKQVLDGWEFAPVWTARTGFPFSIYDTTNELDTTVSARYRSSTAA